MNILWHATQPTQLALGELAPTPNLARLMQPRRAIASICRERGSRACWTWGLTLKKMNYITQFSNPIIPEHENLIELPGVTCLGFQKYFCWGGVRSLFCHPLRYGTKLQSTQVLALHVITHAQRNPKSASVNAHGWKENGTGIWLTASGSVSHDPRKLECNRSRSDGTQKDHQGHSVRQTSLCMPSTKAPGM